MREPELKLQQPVGDEVKQTTCYMCACRCGINVHLREGRIRYIEGNPAHPVNRGVLCAKGSAGILQHYSPARLDKPLLRVGERGEGKFREIEWDEALALAATWLGETRERDPNRLAFFTGRDQSQALTGWWAQQYGTINYAAHGGFCSVNMAAGGLYTLGGSFWEFGEPDWEHAKYLMLWGVAEDHDSNPIKLGLGQLKGRGAKVVAVNPVRSGYGAIADEWIGIRPGTDGLFAFALIHELLAADKIDLDYLVRFTNAHWLVVQNPGGADDGLFARDAEGRALCWNRAAAGGEVGLAEGTGISPAVVGEFALPDGRRAVPVFQLLAQRYLDPQYAPDAVAERCGVPADTIRRIARELAAAAFDEPVVIDQPWTDTHGRVHEKMVGRPVAFHAMRGISAHSNGFHTCRALHLLQLLLGAVDTPGSFRYQPPFPRPIPPANRPGKTRLANGALDAPPLGFIHGPEDLLVDAEGEPRRLDHAYSWRYPLAVHGMLHTVIRNAWAGDPQTVDVLFLFMANMSWNSAMNTSETMRWLTDKGADGEYRIPKIIYSDAYSSEMVAYADLVLPDTTYLERFDAISLLDRPISDADRAADAIRHPVLDAAQQREGRDVRGFQSVLLDLGARIGLPALLKDDGTPRYADYADYIVNHERAPGVGLLAGWRGDGTQHGKGSPNPRQLDRYRENGGFWHVDVPAAGRYFKMANRDYLQWSQGMGFIAKADPVVLQLYSETLQKFRLAAQGHGPVQPPAAERERVARYFDPLPIWYEPFEGAQVETHRYPLSAVTQRPPFMYHAWGSQNAWLRQITARNFLYLHPDTAARHGLVDDDWVHLDSHQGRITVQCRLAGNVQPDTVWTWNAIGKRRGAWKLHKDAPESRKGFLLNHLISDILPREGYANADPVTGQAAWFDLRVSLSRAEAGEDSLPQFAPVDHATPDAAPLRYGALFRGQALMGWDAILTLCVMAGAVALFVSEKLSVDIVAILALSALVLLGVVGPDVAISGFANEATITVAAMFVLSAGLQRTGALRALGLLFARIRWPWAFGLAVMMTVAMVSAFVNNTAAVAVFLPIVLAATAAKNLSPSKYLIPLSYAAQMGGVCTLIGTSTNLLVNSLAKDLGQPGFSLFEFTALGVACTVAGITYLMTVGRWLLPDRAATAITETYELGKYITELRVMPGSPLIGQSVAQSKLAEKFSVYVLELLRGKDQVWSPRAEVMQAGDVLLARGDWGRLSELKDQMKLEIEPEFKLRDEQFTGDSQSLVEVMVAPNSRFAGETLRELDFRWHYNATVLAVHRRGEVLREKIREVTLNVGDILLMLAPRDELPSLRRNPNLVVVTEREDDTASRRRAPLALLIMVAVIVSSGLGLMPIVISALIGCVALVVTKCLEPEEAYEAIDWRIIVLLAGVLPLGIALQQSGAAEVLASSTIGRMAGADPVIVLAVVYLMALVLSELMSNAAAAVLLVPIAVSAAISMGLSPTPFLVAVTFAASTSFSTPVGYQTNTMVYSIGNYRFTDFMKVGIPLNLIFWVIGIIMIPMIWPFTPTP